MGWLSVWEKPPSAAPRGLRAAGGPGGTGASSPPRRDAAMSRAGPAGVACAPRQAGAASASTSAQDDADRAGWVESSSCLAAGLIVVESTDLTPWLLARRLQRAQP
jgi:hypothetical protein